MAYVYEMDCSTGQLVVRQMTPEEEALMQSDATQAQQEEQNAQAARSQKEQQRNQVLQKMAGKTGVSVDELRTLFS